MDFYPAARIIADAALKGKIDDRQAIVRLWLSEGIPFAFRAKPALYESIRVWLANRLDVGPKDITLIGSARLGQSMSPDDNFGREFGAQSDLDISVISVELFSKVRDAYLSWANDYETSTILPRNAAQRKFWPENLRVCSGTIQRGFIDPDKIPTLDRYPIIQAIQQAMYLLPEKLRQTTEAPNVRKASIRTFNNWDAFVNQASLNLEIVARRIIP
ncbi:MAG: hypothetical protein P8Y66_04320 [Nitrospirota bacterium]